MAVLPSQLGKSPAQKTSAGSGVVLPSQLGKPVSTTVLPSQVKLPAPYTPPSIKSSPYSIAPIPKTTKQPVGVERDHIIPKSLGGSSADPSLTFLKDNQNTISKLINTRPTALKNRPEGKAIVEHKAISDFKSGAITLPEARQRVIDWKKHPATTLKGWGQEVLDMANARPSVAVQGSTPLADATPKKVPNNMEQWPQAPMSVAQQQERDRVLADQGNKVPLTAGQNFIDRTLLHPELTGADRIAKSNALHPGTDYTMTPEQEVAFGVLKTPQQRKDYLAHIGKTNTGEAMNQAAMSSITGPAGLAASAWEQSAAKIAASDSAPAIKQELSTLFKGAADDVLTNMAEHFKAITNPSEVLSKLESARKFLVPTVEDLASQGAATVEQKALSTGENKTVSNTRFPSIGDLLSEINRPKNGKQGLNVTKDELTQINKLFSESLDAKNQELRGKVYNAYEKGKQDVILGVTKMEEGGSNHYIVAELDKNGRVTNNIRIHATPIPKSDFVGDINSQLNEQKALTETPTQGAATVEQKALSAGPEIPKYAQSVNLERLATTPAAKQEILAQTEAIKPELEAAKGAPLTHQEVLDAAQTSDVLQRGTTREATKNFEAQLLKTRQQLSALAEGKGVTKDFIETLKTVNSAAADLGRSLGSLRIEATPNLMSDADRIKNQVVTKILDSGAQLDDIIKAGENVDFTDQKQVAQFYRQFVKPSLSEVIKEFRYINLLSSPKTHIVNAFTNLLQTSILNPATRLMNGGVDAIGSMLTGKERSVYASEVKPYYRAVYNSLGDAATNALNVVKGNATFARPDIERIPTLNPITEKFGFVTRALEAGDAFFQTLIKAGEKEAFLQRAAKNGEPITNEVVQQAEEHGGKQANYTLFRDRPLSREEQGHVLKWIDNLTNSVYGLRNKVPGAEWFIPFVQTPMNILKQGIEYSPAGFSTLLGATNKSEQLSKALIGSIVFAGAGAQAMNGNVTWKAPSDPKQKEIFYATGRKPYSILVGNTWIPFSRLGPVSYPFAMAAAAQWYAQEDPKSTTSTVEKKLSNVLAGVGQFFADQSYIQGMNDFLRVMQGDAQAVTDTVANIPQQLVPMAALTRWVTNIVDPVYRQPDQDFSLKSVLQKAATGLPGLSMTVPSYTNPDGSESTRPLPYLNPFLPFELSPKDKEGENLYQTSLKIQRIKSEDVQRQDQLEKDAVRVLEKMQTLPVEQRAEEFKKLQEQDKPLADQVEQTLRDLQSGLSLADQQLKKLNVKNGERAKFIIEEMQKIEKEADRKAYMQKLVDTKIISPAVLAQIVDLLKNNDYPPSNTAHQALSDGSVYPEIQSNSDLEKTKQTALSLPFTDQARAMIADATIGKLKKGSTNTELIAGGKNNLEGEQSPRGADFSNFVTKYIAPFSKRASDFILDHTDFLQKLDKANISIRTTDPEILVHEMLHQVFDRGELSTNPLNKNNPANTERMGEQFLNDWDKVSKEDQDTPLAQIDAHIDEGYDTRNMSDPDLATERYAYLGEMVAKYGTSVIPKDLRPYYRSVFVFKN